MAAQLIASIVALATCTFGAGVYFVYTEFQLDKTRHMPLKALAWKSVL